MPQPGPGLSDWYRYWMNSCERQGKYNVRIWIDITNSPHVNFFADLIREWSDQH